MHFPVQPVLYRKEMLMLLLASLRIELAPNLAGEE